MNCRAATDLHNIRTALGKKSDAHKESSVMKTGRKKILHVHDFLLRVLARSERYQLLSFLDHTFSRFFEKYPTGFCSTASCSFVKLSLLCITSFLSGCVGHTQLEVMSGFQQSKTRNRKTKLTNVLRARRRPHSRNEYKRIFKKKFGSHIVPPRHGVAH